MSQEVAHMLCLQVTRMPLAVKQNVSLDPGPIRFFSAQTEVSEASYITYLIQQLPFGHHRRIIPQYRVLSSASHNRFFNPFRMIGLMIGENIRAAFNPKLNDVLSRF